MKATLETHMTRYPVPGPVGGALLRKIVADFRRFSEGVLELPFGTESHPVFLAVSGGLDSTALFLLLVKYGRRLVPKNAIRVLHVNHGWRDEASLEDEAFVRSLAAEFQTPIDVLRAQKPDAQQRTSWEDHARRLRQQFFSEQLAQAPSAWLMTAHQADDQAETLLWRLFTGTSDTHGAGILRVQSEARLLRPLLGIRRQELQAFLEEEGRNWRIDQTNFDTRFLRAQLRRELLPVVERIFPKGIERLLSFSEQASGSRTSSAKLSTEADLLHLFWGAAGLSLRRPHVKHMLDALQSGAVTHIDLPEGWVFRKDSDAQKERWVVERFRAGASSKSSPE